MRYKIIPYQEEKVGFVRRMNGLFFNHGLSGLEFLHNLCEEKYNKLFEVGSDSSTIFHKLFYDRYKGGWDSMVETYEMFIHIIVAPLFDEDFLYQSFPTARFHLPGNVAVGHFHTDSEFHHPAGEVNFIIPLTNSEDTASVWVESEPGKEDFEDIKLRIGELIQFNGSVLKHGNKVNTTDRTRVSMDFRILPVSRYDESLAQKSMTTKTKFVEGEYYKRFKKFPDKYALL
jgi:hypothetical protein